MSWLYSQALVAEYSAENCLDGEPSAQLNVMPTQAKFWRNDKTMEFSNLSQFGLTLPLLTADRGEALLTWYLAGFHAKTLAPQEKAQVLKAQEAECGKKWHGLLAKYDPLTHSLKTAQCSLLEDLEQSLQTWPRWGLMRNGECYLRPMLARPTSEKEFGLLPNNETFFHTPNTTGLDGASNSRKALKKRVEQCPTPDANMGARVTQPEWTPTRKSGQPAQYTINQAVRDSLMWPTPCATDSKGAGKTGQLRDRLDYAVERGATKSKTYWATPRAFMHKDSTEDRGKSNLGEQVGGQLNPTWVEWLMGWPLEWTDLKPLATDKCHCAQQQHLNCLETD
jgi:hypothetical protein